MKSTHILAIFIGLSMAFQTSMFAQEKTNNLYRNKAFTVTKDSVIEGKSFAKVISPTEISSNYHFDAEANTNVNKMKNKLLGKRVKENTTKEKDSVYQAKTWKLSKDISALPQFDSDIPIANAMYNLSLEEMLLDIRPDTAFMAGKEWEGVWTRDISYSILLSLAILKPENAKISLLKKVQNGMIIQDTGTGGSYPVSTDRMTWALAAYEIYAVTGDKNWLKQAYDIIKKSSATDLQVAFDAKTNLFLGESSFLDWREQTYPKWMEPKDIYNAVCLGTNAVHYQTYKVLDKMATDLGENSVCYINGNPRSYKEIAENIKKGINQWLWNEEKKYYGQFRYGLNYQSLSPKSEGLGEALCVLFDIADENRKKQVIANTPLLMYGLPCIYPQIDGIENYHNNAIWSFVQAFWNWSAAKTANEKAVEHGIASIYRQAAFFLTNKENMVASTGNFEGTVINSDRQLWSVAGNLSTVYRVFFGMEFQANKLVFNPFVPKNYGGTKTLKNFTYRKATIDITLKGSGNKIRKITLDGNPISKAELEGNLTGKHSLEIELNGKGFEEHTINIVGNSATFPTPLLIQEKNKLVWKDGFEKQKKGDEDSNLEKETPKTSTYESWGNINSKQKKMYELWENGKKLQELPDSVNTWTIPESKNYAEYQIKIIDMKGNESFLSNAIVVSATEIPMTISSANLEQQKSKAISSASDTSGFVLAKSQKQTIKLEVKVPKQGKYAIDFLYANPNGPINTDNKCAIRTLLLSGNVVGTVVFPQRGLKGMNTGYTNSIIVDLAPATYNFTLAFLEYNENMNGEVNEAILKSARLRKID